jgi:hypothetical protein
MKEQLKPYKTVEQIAKKHRMDVSDIQKQLDMGAPIEHEHTRNKKLAVEIALQHLDEFPDYYTRLKKMEASAKKEHKKFKDIIPEKESVIELERRLVKLSDISYDSIDKLMRIIMKKYVMTAKELHNAFVKKHGKKPDDWVKEKLNEGNLNKWFGDSKSKGGKPGWVNVVTGGTCASDEPGEGVPKCVSSEKRESMTKEERLSASRRKKAADKNQQSKSGAAKPTYVPTDKPKKKMNEESDVKGKGSGTKDACYTKVKSRYSVWPSAYASGALVKCRKVGAANWGTKTEETQMTRYCPKCEKDETREECRYGPKYWDMFSIPSSLSQNQIKFSIAQVHPANESKEPDHEYSMARSELSTIISAAKRLRGKLNGEGNIEAWVQSKITKAADYIDAAADYLDSGEHDVEEACWKGYKQVGMKKKGKKIVPNCVEESVSIEDANGNPYVEFIDIMKPEPLKVKKGIGSRILGEGPSFEVGSSKLTSAQEKLHTMSPSQRSQLPSQMVKKLVGVDLPPLKASPSSMVKTADSYEPERKSFTEFMLEASAAWQRKEGKNPEGGLNAAGVASYRKENPGSKLQTAVTTKPSKLKPGSKDAKRRKSFCARMGGMPGPMKDEKGRPTRKALSLRKWNCN